MFSKSPVEERRKYLQYCLWNMGYKNLTGNEKLVDLERMYIKAMYQRGNLTQSGDNL